MRGIGVLYIVLEEMEVVVHVTGTLLLWLQLNNSWEEGPIGCDRFIKEPSLSI